MRLLPVLSLYAATLLSAHSAALIGDPADGIVFSNGVISTSAAFISPGTFGDSSVVGIFVFQLPALGPGETFGAVSLQLFLNGRGGSLSAPFNLDLYGLGARTDASPLSTDYFIGAFGTDSSDATPLHDNLVTPADNSKIVTTSGGAGAGSASLSGYLNVQYAEGANAGKFVFFRLGPDAAGGESDFVFFSANSQFPETRPVLQYSVVPEPSAAASLCMSGVALALCRLRAQRKRSVRE